MAKLGMYSCPEPLIEDGISPGSLLKMSFSGLQLPGSSLICEKCCPLLQHDSSINNAKESSH